MEYLRQDLGYIYSGLLDKGSITVSVVSDSIGYNETVTAVKPKIVDYYQNPPRDEIEMDIGGGAVRIDYAFMEIDDSGYYRYYKKSMSSSGVEIRINGRLMMSNVFKEIWGIENHPSYNHFLGTINISSEDSRKLPRTRTSKNGIRSDDEKLQNLFEWIQKINPRPEKKLTNAIYEKELVKELASLKEKSTRSKAKRIDVDFRVFETFGAPVLADLYYFDGHEVVVYEAKKGTATIQDFYQLLMYWDGLVQDGITPNEGILLALEFTPGVENIIGYYNNRTDANSNNYNFSTTSWKNEGVDYSG